MFFFPSILAFVADCCRYLGLLQTGAKENSLEPSYVAWLEGLKSVDARQRGKEYYSSPEGIELMGWPKIRVGMEDRKRGGQPRSTRRNRKIWHEDYQTLSI